MGSKGTPNYIFKVFLRMRKYFKLIDETHEVYCYNEDSIVNFLEPIDIIAVGGNRILSGIKIFGIDFVKKTLNHQS